MASSPSIQEVPDRRTEPERAPLVARVAAVASRQHGCVTRRDLIAAGITSNQIGSLTQRAVLLPVLRGVYLFGGPRLSVTGLWWSALAWSGAGSRLASRSALECLGVLPASTDEVTVNVLRRTGRGTRTTPTLVAVDGGRGDATLVREVATRRRRPAMHTSAGLAVDLPAHAIAELSAAGHERDVRRAWREADYLGLLDPDTVRAAIVAQPAARGLLLSLLREHPLVGGEGVDLRSRGERRLLEALRKAGVEPPRVNALVDVGGRMLRPDLWWPWARLIVEVDGPGHRRPARAAEDAERDEYLRAHGFVVLRFTDDEVWHQTDACLAAITRAIAACMSA